MNCMVQSGGNTHLYDLIPLFCLEVHLEAISIKKNIKKKPIKNDTLLCVSKARQIRCRRMMVHINYLG